MFAEVREENEGRWTEEMDIQPQSICFVAVVERWQMVDKHPITLLLDVWRNLQA